MLRFTHLTSIAAAFVLCSCATTRPLGYDPESARLHFQSDADIAEGHLIFLNGRLAGRLGDEVSLSFLPEGDVLSLPFSPEISARIEIPFSGRNLSQEVRFLRLGSAKTINSVIQSTSDCINGFSADIVWSEPSITSNEASPITYTLTFGHPSTKAKETPIACGLPKLESPGQDFPPLPPSAADTGSPTGTDSTTTGTTGTTTGWGYITSESITFTSDPTGAEIIVDNFSVGRTTATVNIAFPRTGQHVYAVVRKPGFINCRWAIVLPIYALQDPTYHCKFLPVRR